MGFELVVESMNDLLAVFVVYDALMMAAFTTDDAKAALCRGTAWRWSTERWQGLLCATLYSVYYIHIEGGQNVGPLFTAFLFNPLMGTVNDSTTSSNMKFVHWPLMGGLLHLVQRRGNWAGLQPAQAPPHCTKCNSPPVNDQCTNHFAAGLTRTVQHCSEGHKSVLILYCNYISYRFWDIHH